MKFLFLVFILAQSAWSMDFFEIKEKTIDGKEIKMSDFKGKTLLIVNIASQCGYTSQLSELESLHQKMKGKNVVVIGVPTNDFGGQTPEADAQMKEFCQKKYSVTFPLLSKRTIQGKEKRDLYVFLTEKTPTKLRGEVSWNFEKFIVSPKGVVTTRFRSSMDPMDKEVVSALENASRL